MNLIDEYIVAAVKVAYYQGRMDALNDEDHLEDLIENSIYTKKLKEALKSTTVHNCAREEQHGKE